MKYLLLVFFMLTTTGCTFASLMFDTNHWREEYLEHNKSVGNERPPNIARAILDRRVVPGMYIEDAKAAWGPTGGWRQSRINGSNYWTFQEYVLVMRDDGKVHHVDSFGLPR